MVEDYYHNQTIATKLNMTMSCNYGQLYSLCHVLKECLLTIKNTYIYLHNYLLDHNTKLEIVRWRSKGSIPDFFDLIYELSHFKMLKINTMKRMYKWIDGYTT